MNTNTEWLENHCFEYDNENNVYQRIKEWSKIKLFAKYLNEINKWIVYARINVDGVEYKFSMMMENITDDNFRMFVLKYNKEVEKWPFGYLAHYYLRFNNNIIS